MSRPETLRLKAMSDIDLAALEADVAYFDARITFAGEHPGTSYQLAQKKAYQALGEVMTDTLRTLRGSKVRL